MIPEQAVGSAAGGESRKAVGEQFEKRCVVTVVGEDTCFLIPPREDVVQQTRRMQAQRTAHRRPSGKTRSESELRVIQGIPSWTGPQIPDRAMSPLLTCLGFCAQYYGLLPKEDRRARNKI